MYNLSNNSERVAHNSLTVVRESFEPEDVCFTFMNYLFFSKMLEFKL